MLKKEKSTVPKDLLLPRDLRGYYKNDIVIKYKKLLKSYEGLLVIIDEASTKIESLENFMHTQQVL